MESFLDVTSPTKVWINSSNDNNENTCTHSSEKLNCDNYIPYATREKHIKPGGKQSHRDRPVGHTKVYLTTSLIIYQAVSIAVYLHQCDYSL